MRTNDETIKNSTEETRAASRFAYHGDDDPGEGGVHTVPERSRDGSKERTVSPPAMGERAARAPGIPGPEEKLLDISELVRTVGMRYTHRFAFPPRTLPDVTTVTPTTGTLRLTNSGAVLILRGEVETMLGMECSRCLTPTEQPIETEIEEEFPLVASNNAYSQEEVHAVDEDTPAAVISGNVLNLADLLRQNIELAAPLQPLCREDCPGIAHESNLGPEPEAVFAPDPEPLEVGADNPLRHLAEMLEAKRQRETSR